jgi:DNA gyrase subunit A
MPSSDGVAAMLTRSGLRAGRRFIHATGGARIKASSVRDFGRGAQINGMSAFLLAPGDSVVSAFVESQDHTAVFCANAAGNGIRFKFDDVRTMGLKAQGVKSMAIAEFDAVVGAMPVGEEGQVLVLSAMGSAKRVPLSQFRIQGRAGQGMILMRPHLNGDELVRIFSVQSLNEDLLVWTQRGSVARIPIGRVALADRSSKGQDGCLRLDDGDRVAGGIILPGAG